MPIKSAQDDSILYHSMIAKILIIIVNNNNNDSDNSHIKQKVCKSPAFASFFKSSVPVTLQMVFKFMWNSGMKIKQNYEIKQNKIKEKKKKFLHTAWFAFLSENWFRTYVSEVACSHFEIVNEQEEHVKKLCSKSPLNSARFWRRVWKYLSLTDYHFQKFDF